jgi:hypothetical protein
MARHRLTLASTDSLSRFDAWHGEIGREAAGTSGDDFDDIAPDRWRTTGPPRLDLRTERFADLFHFDRIEGAYTGFGAVVRLRDAAPGLSARATAGWAWSEQTIRGRAGATWRRGPWMLGALGGRGLDITNDFHSPFDSGSTLGALLSQDDYDYVDRRFATLSVARELGGRNGTVLRLAAGPASDHRARRHVKRGLWPSDSTFRENRGVDEGSYARSAASIEYHPDVNIEFVRPGVGALLSYERGDGALDWQRAEGRLVARRGWRAFTVATRLDAGVVLGDRPPQQLFELGEEGRLLPGYRYKEFAGDQAVSLRTMALYDLPYLRSPIRVGRRLLPSPAPALWVGAQSGWTGASGNVARQSIRRLGDRRDPKTGVALLDPITGLPLPVSRLTGGVRTSVDLGLRFFGGAVGLGVARAVDHEARWRFEVSFVQEM